MSLNTKRGLAVDQTYPDYAVLVPEPVKGLPYKVFATSSIDALIHAIESFLSPKASVFTKMFSREAIRLIMQGYKAIAYWGENARFDYMKEFLTAATYAGIAFGNAGVGAVHALSYSIGNAFHVPHGEANYQFLNAVLRIYAAKKAPDHRMQQLTEMIDYELELNADSAPGVYKSFELFLDKLVHKKQLREYGMTEEQIDEFAASTIQNQQRLLINNYVPLDDAEIKGIFAELY